jgi:hypothetical protein
MPHTAKHRQARTAGGSVPTKCPYPDCALDEYHDGEHDKRGTKPRGAVRVLQMVNRNAIMASPIHCEVCCPRVPMLADWFCVDSIGNGWLLCCMCACLANQRVNNASE